MRVTFKDENSVLDVFLSHSKELMRQEKLIAEKLKSFYTDKNTILLSTSLYQYNLLVEETKFLHQEVSNRIDRNIFQIIDVYPNSIGELKKYFVKGHINLH